MTPPRDTPPARRPRPATPATGTLPARAIERPTAGRATAGRAAAERPTAGRAAAGRAGARRAGTSAAPTRLPALRLSAVAADRAKAAVVVIGVGRDDAGGPRPAGGTEEVDAALGGQLAATLRAAGVTGRAGETVRIPVLGALAAPALLAVGLGPAADGYDLERLRRAAGDAARALAGETDAAVTLASAALGPGMAPDPAAASGPGPLAGPAEAVRAVAEGLLLGAYDFVGCRSTTLAARPAPLGAATLLTPQARSRAVTAALAAAVTVGEAVALVRDLVNTPPGDLPPARLADRARAAAKEVGLTVEVLDESALARGGYGGILGVGQGSGNPPRLVRVGYAPQRPRARVALVGKGITFDSGGLSLKPSASMETMKSDMAGAAAVLGATIAAARMRLPVAVTAWLPTAENMPSGAAIRPGDVLETYNGTRVEVTNTDAEGRLVLADALARAAEEGCDLLVDVATLTGAQIVALGARTAAVMSNDDATREQVLRAAAAAGEAFWPMPLPEELRPGLDSPVADLGNMGDAKLGGGMLVAGLFLREFVPAGQPWAHLDIAGPSFNSSPAYGYTPRGGTGAPVRTLVRLLEDLAEG